MQKTSVPIEEDVLLTDKQIMKICRISKSTKKRWVQQYGLPRPFYIGQTPYTRRSDLEAWLKSRDEAGSDFHLPHHLKGKSASVDALA